eukprot:NODE_36_length_31474_cov_0.342438.p13 type:complete len:286 gc:universal NODE_36_length_31474_cov_0.342438:27823-28680(+)
MVEKKSINWTNLAVGGFIQILEVSTLGQPFEVLKTHMAAQRGDNLRAAIRKTYQRGGIFGYWQGLVPWAWIEAGTKGAVLMFTSYEVEHILKNFGVSSTLAAVSGGAIGGVAQAYTTMGFCTFMKTVEVTRLKDGRGTLEVAASVWKAEGWKGMNKGVSAVALRQMTNWGSRFGISRFVESLMKGSSDRKLSRSEKVLSSAIGGALACWNQPFEVIRVEMQSQLKDKSQKNFGFIDTAKFIYSRNGISGFYRGVTPRVCLGVYLTICMVSFNLSRCLVVMKPRQQ